MPHTAAIRATRKTSSKFLVAIDDRPLRKSAAKELLKVYRTYCKSFGELRHHETTVRPSYFRWLAKICGERLERLERLERDLLRKTFLLQRMRDLCIFESYSRALAFRQAQAELDEAEAEPPEEEAEREPAGEEPEFEQPDFDGWGDDAGGFSEDESLPEIERMPEELSFETRLKSVYRKLAQALHPDLATEETEIARELWHETQEAYKTRDLGVLEMLWSVILIQTDPLSRELRVSEIKTAIASFHERLKKVKSEKRKLARKDPSWSFEKKDKDELADKIRRDLDHQQEMLEMSLEEVEDDLEALRG